MNEQRSMLDPQKIHPAALSSISQFHKDVVDEVATAVRSTPVVVVGMAGNPHVKRVKSALSDAGVEFRYLEYGSYLSQWRARLAIKMWSGWPTFPQVFVDGKLVGGSSDTRKLLTEGTFKQLLGSVRA